MDGVRLAVLNNRLQGVARAMQNTLARTGRSGVLNTARDFSCCILTAEAELLATAESLPIHVMSGPDLMAARIRLLHPDLRRGDAFLHNSPYHGNSHAADHCLIVPVIDDDGVHRFTVLGKAHQADCGNALPTTYHAAARDVYEEGALIFDAVRVQRDYEDIDDVIRMCRLRIRVPEQWWGDYLALVGAVRIGERRLLELGAEVGWERTRAVLARVVRLLRATHGVSARGAARRVGSSPRAHTIHSRASQTESRSGWHSRSTPTARRSGSTCATTSTASPAGST